MKQLKKKLHKLGQDDLTALGAYLEIALPIAHRIDSNMNTQWQIIFHYEIDHDDAVQSVYDEIFKAALKFKFKDRLAVPINDKTLTEVIFGLTDHDKVAIAGKTINGQKVKELFITTIFLKYLETKFKPGDHLFVVIPPQETSCDTAIIVAPSEAPPIMIDGKQMKLTPVHYPFYFQVKEYFDFKRMQNDDISIEPFNPDKASKVLGNKDYSETLLIYVRDLMDYNSETLKPFFDKHPNCYLMSATNHAEVDGKAIKMDLGKHNFIVSFPDGETMYHAFFEKPRFLLSGEEVTSILGFNPSF